MTDDAKAPYDPLVTLARTAAASLSFDSDPQELRDLAARLLGDERAACRLGRLIGTALDRHSRQRDDA